MAEVIPMAGEQKFRLEIYRLLPKNNSAAEEAFTFIDADQPKLKLFKLHYSDGGTNPDFTSRTIEAVRESKEALDLFTTEAWYEPRNQFG